MTITAIKKKNLWVYFVYRSSQEERKKEKKRIMGREHHVSTTLNTVTNLDKQQVNFGELKRERNNFAS